MLAIQLVSRLPTGSDNCPAIARGQQGSDSVSRNPRNR